MFVVTQACFAQNSLQCRTVLNRSALMGQFSTHQFWTVLNRSEPFGKSSYKSSGQNRSEPFCTDDMFATNFQGRTVQNRSALNLLLHQL